MDISTRTRVIAWVTAALLLVGLAVAHLQAAPPDANEPAVGAGDALAKDLMSRAGICRGIVSLPRCGDGQLAMAMARNSGMLVHAMDSRPENVSATRRLAQDAGLLGRQIYVERGELSSLPLADNYADLLVVADLQDADLARLECGEILRVLSAGRGKALLGRAGAGGGLTQVALEAWVKKIGIADAKVVQDARGLWAVISKPRLAGSDDWTHQLHGPDNNPVSKDMTFKWPYLVQYLGKPYLGDSGARESAAGGRLFVMCGWWYRVPGAWKDPTNSLHAYNVYNGRELWSKNLTASHLTDFGAHRSALVATDSVVYVLEGNAVLVLDAETGAQIRSIALDKTGEEGKWIALSDGVLFALGGDKDPAVKLSATTYPGVVTSVVPQTKAIIGMGKKIAAFDAGTGKDLWVHEEDKPIEARCLAISAGKLFFYSEQSRAGCLDGRTGRLLWTNADAQVLAAFADGPWKENTPYGVMATPDAVYISRGAKVALSAKDGTLLWKDDKNRVGGRFSAQNLLLIGDRLQSSVGMLLEPLTGKPKVDARGTPVRAAVWGVCDQRTALDTPYGHDNPVNQQRLNPTGVKPPCDSGMIVADGVMFASPNACVCDSQTKGFTAFSAANDFKLDQPANAADRLERGDGELNPAAALQAGAKDWPVYRGNAQRNGSSGATVSPKAAVLWQYQPAHPFVNEPWPDTLTTEADHKPTAAICIAGWVFFAGTDGVVHCLDSQTGLQKWSFATDGPVHACPTFWEGRLYVGSADGCAYALEAATGRLLWRFRGAPEPRRILVYGQLQSSWPVDTGVFIHEGVAYFAAGMRDEMGTHIYALDAKSGGIIWQNNDSGHAYMDDMHHGVTPGGGMVVAQGRLWLCTWHGLTISYDLKTGQLDTGGDVSKFRGRVWLYAAGLSGQEIGLVDDRFLIHGGFPIYGMDEGNKWENNGALNHRRQFCFEFMELDAAGKALYPAISPVRCSGLTPAWDQRSMVVTTDGMKTLECWDTAKTSEFLRATRLQKAPTKTSFADYDAQGMALHLQADPEVKRNAAPPEFPMRQWSLKVETNAAALGDNAVVVTQGLRKDLGKAPRFLEIAPFTSWSVVALDRKDGREIWRQPIPSEPLCGSVSIDRNGSAIVMLRDGGVMCIGAQQ